MRQIILDTETTGLEVAQDHRIIEIGCVELNDRRPTGRTFHAYLYPDREVDPEALVVHGITNEFLAGQRSFADVAGELLEFLGDAELVIHNAEFDIGFLNAEFARLPGEPVRIDERCAVLDTLALARQMHPGQRNSLDALCRRYGVDNSDRELHGALLDANILLQVYLAMTGGQAALTLEHDTPGLGGPGQRSGRARRGDLEIPVLRPTAAEAAAHEHALEAVARASGGRVLFRGAQH